MKFSVKKCCVDDGAMTLRITTFSIKTLSIKGLFSHFYLSSYWMSLSVIMLVSLWFASWCWVLLCWISLCWVFWHLLTWLVKGSSFLVLVSGWRVLVCICKKWKFLWKMLRRWWRNDTQDNEFQHKNTQHKDIICDFQHKWNLA